MPIDLIDYALAEEREGEGVAMYSLTDGQNQLAIQALGLIQQNPDIFIKEYSDYDPDDIDTLIDAALTALMDATVNEVVPSVRFRLFGDSYNTLVGALSWVNLATVYNAGYWSLASAQNNLVGWSFVSMKRGKYQVEILGRRNSAQGIVSIVIDGTTVITIDMYNATNLENEKILSSDFTLTTDGVHTVSAKMATKNASSSGYGLIFHHLDFYRISEI